MLRLLTETAAETRIALVFAPGVGFGAASIPGSPASRSTEESRGRDLETV